MSAISWFLMYARIISTSRPIVETKYPLGCSDHLVRHAPQWRLVRLIASARAPTRIKLTAQIASRLNQLRDTNLRPRWR
jgi:hypothetical protein